MKNVEDLPAISGDGLMSANHQTVAALQRALEDAGVVFNNGDEPGVTRSGKSWNTALPAVVAYMGRRPKAAPHKDHLSQNARPRAGTSDRRPARSRRAIAAHLRILTQNARWTHQARGS